MIEGLKIGQVARQTGLTTKTIRYYEMVGLVKAPQRTYSGYRVYGQKDVDRLVFIKKAKNLGFSLDDIRDTLAIHDVQGSPCVHVLALLDQKIAEVGFLIEEFIDFQRGLKMLREDSTARVGESGDDSICGIVDRGAHIKGQQALTWLESRRKA
ncbi:MAG: heavy metal-responsive transcriptional regulator [Dehalococcoidia bacterium]